MHLRLPLSRSSGWLPAAILGLATVAVLAAYGTPILEMAAFGLYIVVGIALPGMLWVRRLRGRAAHLSEDIALGLAVGYCLEIAAYVIARAVGVPLLFLLWPALTLLAFVTLPSLRQYWRGSGERAPRWWSWSLALMLGYVLVYSAGRFFAQHHLTGTDTPYVDMPYHLSLIGELRHHMPPAIPYVSGVPLAYHWFYYAEAAATSWATGIEPVTLLYRLSGLPFFAAFVVLTAQAARRLTGGWWSGPVAVAIALFSTVAAPYRWAGAPVFDTQTLDATWISPTNLFGLVLFAAVIVVLMDLLTSDRRPARGQWLLLAVLVGGIAGAKASLVPMLIVGLVVVIGGVAISQSPAPATGSDGAGNGRHRPWLGRDRALPREHRWPCHRTGFAAFASGRGPGRRRRYEHQRRGRCHRGLAGGAGALVVPVGRRLRTPRPTDWFDRGSSDPLAARDLRQRARCRDRLLVSWPESGVLPARRRRRIRVADRGRDRSDAARSRARSRTDRGRRDDGGRGCRSGPHHPRARAHRGADPGRRRSPRRHVAILLPILALVGVVAVSYVLITRLAEHRSWLRGATGILLVALTIGFSLPSVAALHRFPDR